MKNIFSYIILLLTLNSCIKNNPNPAWIEIDTWILNKNPDATYYQGEMTHNFSDAWVFINGKAIGVFELPIKIPVLESGEATIRLYPTIRNNGIAATKKIYPFVNFYELKTTLNSDQTIHIQPTTKYYDNVQFWVEEFEDVITKIENDPNSSVSLVLGSDPTILKWGNFYGQVNLNSTDSTWFAYTSGEMYLPKGKEVYLEVDYYNTNKLITGLLSISSTSIKNNQNIQLNSQKIDEVRWKKIYIDLRELVSNSSDAEYFKQSFQAMIDDNASEGLIILDNIKVVHF